MGRDFVDGSPLSFFPVTDPASSSRCEKLLNSVSALIAKAVKDMKGVDDPQFMHTSGKIIELVGKEIVPKRNKSKKLN